ncbi:unnamed protein product, partial [Mesorhabditis belari]|uniref:Uncharacterized protein n=1 Tax=Mesorhabditis belari TaxID=2138241 RepID=A0AAF3F0J4_9BILA
MMLRLGVLALLAVFVFGEESIEKRDYAPALEAEEALGNMRALFNVGKRQLSLADDTDAQWQMYKQLYSAGKRKRSSLAPSQQFSNYARLLDAGKKRSLFAPSQELGMYSHLMEAGRNALHHSLHHKILESIPDFMRPAKNAAI